MSDTIELVSDGLVILHDLGPDKPDETAGWTEEQFWNIPGQYAQAKWDQRQKMVSASANLVAWLCAKYNIPMEWRSPFPRKAAAHGGSNDGGHVRNVEDAYDPVSAAYFLIDPVGLAAGSPQGLLTAGGITGLSTFNILRTGDSTPRYYYGPDGAPVEGMPAGAFPELKYIDKVRGFDWSMHYKRHFGGNALGMGVDAFCGVKLPKPVVNTAQPPDPPIVLRTKLEASGDAHGSVWVRGVDYVVAKINAKTAFNIRDKSFSYEAMAKVGPFTFPIIDPVRGTAPDSGGVDSPAPVNLQWEAAASEEWSYRFSLLSISFSIPVGPFNVDVGVEAGAQAYAGVRTGVAALAIFRTNQLLTAILSQSNFGPYYNVGASAFLEATAGGGAYLSVWGGISIGIDGIVSVGVGFEIQGEILNIEGRFGPRLEFRPDNTETKVKPFRIAANAYLVIRPLSIRLYVYVEVEFLFWSKRWRARIWGYDVPEIVYRLDTGRNAGREVTWAELDTVERQQRTAVLTPAQLQSPGMGASFVYPKFPDQFTWTLPTHNCNTDPNAPVDQRYPMVLTPPSNVFFIGKRGARGKFERIDSMTQPLGPTQVSLSNTFLKIPDVELEWGIESVFIVREEEPGSPMADQDGIGWKETRTIVIARSSFTHQPPPISSARLNASGQNQVTLQWANYDSSKKYEITRVGTGGAEKKTFVVSPTVGSEMVTFVDSDTLGDDQIYTYTVRTLQENAQFTEYEYNESTGAWTPVTRTIDVRGFITPPIGVATRPAKPQALQAVFADGVENLAVLYWNSGSRYSSWVAARDPQGHPITLGAGRKRIAGFSYELGAVFAGGTTASDTAARQVESISLNGFDSDARGWVKPGALLPDGLANPEGMILKRYIPRRGQSPYSEMRALLVGARTSTSLGTWKSGALASSEVDPFDVGTFVLDREYALSWNGGGSCIPFPGYREITWWNDENPPEQVVSRVFEQRALVVGGRDPSGDTAPRPLLLASYESILSTARTVEIQGAAGVGISIGSSSSYPAPLNVTNRGYALIVGGSVIRGGVETPSATVHCVRQGDEETSLTLPSMQRARVGHTAHLLQNRLVVIGGSEDDARIEILDLATMTWAYGPPLLQNRRGHRSSYLLKTGRILITGGVALPGGRAEPGMLLSSCEFYDPRVVPERFGVIYGGESLPSARTEHAQVPDAAAYEDSWPVVIAGGRTATGVLDEALIFEPATHYLTTQVLNPGGESTTDTSRVLGMSTNRDLADFPDGTRITYSVSLIGQYGVISNPSDPVTIVKGLKGPSSLSVVATTLAPTTATLLAVVPVQPGSLLSLGTVETVLETVAEGGTGLAGRDFTASLTQIMGKPGVPDDQLLPVDPSQPVVVSNLKEGEFYTFRLWTRLKFTNDTVYHYAPAVSVELITPPAAPERVFLHAPSGLVIWQDTSAHETGYVIYRDGGLLRDKNNGNPILVETGQVGHHYGEATGVPPKAIVKVNPVPLVRVCAYIRVEESTPGAVSATEANGATVWRLYGPGTLATYLDTVPTGALNGEWGQISGDPWRVGWRIMGIVGTTPVEASRIGPTEARLGDFFGFDPGGGYTRSSTLQPGYGYWTKTAPVPMWQAEGTRSSTPVAVTLGRGGWHLLANPHDCDIVWRDSYAPTILQNGVFVFRENGYEKVQNGGRLRQFEGFWIKAGGGTVTIGLEPAR